MSGSESAPAAPLAGAAPAPARDPLATAAGISFLLLVLAIAGPIAPMSITSVLCATLTLALFTRTPRPRWPVTPVLLPGVAWLLAIALSSAFALEPAHSIVQLKKGILPLLAGLAAFHAADRRPGRRALAVYLGAAGFAAAASVLAWWAHGHNYEWRARGLSHYMTFGGQLQIQFPIALAIALLSKSPRWRWGAAAVAGLTAIALATTFTRSSWLGGFTAAMLVAVAVWPWGAALLAVLAGLAWTFAPGEWGARLHSMFQSHQGYNGERLLMWKAGLHMFRDHPLTGVGLEDLHAIYWRYKEPGATERVGHLHNTYVMVAATMGVTGIAVFTWLYAALVRTAWPAVALTRDFSTRLRAGGEGAALQLGVTAALAGFLVAGLFEFNFGDEELLYQLYVLVGLAWASRHWGESGGSQGGA